MAEMKTTSLSEERQVCGIIMPISEIDGCAAEHWAEVLSVLRDVIRAAGFEANLVSDADEIGIIQKRIVQNVYSNEIVICDVSGKNPNVMFELGMRLAFDKATIIIKDDSTDYAFDTSVIEHLGYPRDLRFTKIVEFKEKLRAKIIATHEKSKSDPNYSTFLKSFGEYKISRLQQTEVSSDTFILKSLEELKRSIHNLSRPKTSLLDLSRSEYLKSIAQIANEDSHEPFKSNSACIRGAILKFAETNSIFTTSELQKRKQELVSFVISDDHVVNDHGPLERVIHDVLLTVERDPNLGDDLAKLPEGSKSTSPVTAENNS